MILTATTDTIKAVTGSAPTTNDLIYVTALGEIETTNYGLSTFENKHGTFNTTAATICSAPASGRNRKVMMINIFNADTAAATVTINQDFNGTSRVLWKGVLLSGEQLYWSHTSDWKVRNVNGHRKTSVTLPVDNLYSMKGFVADASTNKTLTSGTDYLLFMGSARRNYSTRMDITLNVGVAAATITWGEMAVYRGPLTLGSVAGTLTRVGYVDASGTSYLGVSTGTKVCTIPFEANKEIREGEGIWLVIGGVWTTAAQIKSGLQDDIATGLFQTLTGSVRPSINTTITPGAIDSTNRVPWVFGAMV